MAGPGRPSQAVRAITTPSSSLQVQAAGTGSSRFKRDIGSISRKGNRVPDCHGRRRNAIRGQSMTLSQAHPDQLLHASEGGPLRIIAVAASDASGDSQLRSFQPARTTIAGNLGDSWSMREATASTSTSCGPWSRDDRIIATVLGVPSPGRTAMMFATRLRSPQRNPPFGRLIEHAVRQLAYMDIHIAQILLDRSQGLTRQVALAGGFIDLRG